MHFFMAYNDIKTQTGKSPIGSTKYEKLHSNSRSQAHNRQNINELPLHVKQARKLPDNPLAKLARVDYRTLNSRQQENFNFAKLGAVLADYGFAALRLSDDWKGADLIAVHVDGEHDIKVQLKGRLTFERKYLGKALWIAFRHADAWYLYDHDALFARVKDRIEQTTSWREYGGYSWPGPPDWSIPLLEEYRL
jgi:hypothetical protein